MDILTEADLGFSRPVQTSGNDHFCICCAKFFRRRADLAVHAFKVHDRIRAVRNYVLGTACEACLKVYSHHTDL